MTGGQLRELRLKLGLNQRAVAKHFSVSVPCISRWESAAFQEKELPEKYKIRFRILARNADLGQRHIEWLCKEMNAWARWAP